MVRSALSLVLIGSRSLPTVLLANTLTPLLWCCGNGFIVDHVFMTRFLAELNALLLTRSVSCASEAGVGNLIAAVLDDSWLNNILQEAHSGTSTGSSSYNIRKQVFKDRFVLSLCRGAERMLPAVINRSVRKLAAPSVCELPEGGREFGFVKLLTVENILDDDREHDKENSNTAYNPYVVLQRYLTCVNNILKKCSR
jgi:hypothetical protein